MFLAADELDMGEVLAELAIHPRIINLINIFHLILMHIISFDVFFLLGKTNVILRYCVFCHCSIITFLMTKLINAYVGNRYFMYDKEVR